MTVGTYEVASFDMVASARRDKAARWGNLDQQPTPLIGAELARLVPEYPALLDHASDLAGELDGHIDRHGAVAGVEAFLEVGRSPQELLDRRAIALLAARLCFWWSGAQPRLPVPNGLAPHPCCRRRPLRALEVALVRADTYDDVTLLTALRLIGGGASVAEAARATTADVELRKGQAPLVFTGGGRGRHPRALILPPDCELDLAELVVASSDGFLLQLGRAEGDKARMEALDRRIRTVLNRTGFEPGGRVTASSIRLAGLKVIADRFGFEAALHCSGHTSAVRLRDELRCSCGTSD